MTDSAGRGWIYRKSTTDIQYLICDETGHVIGSVAQKRHARAIVDDHNARLPRGNEWPPEPWTLGSGVCGCDGLWSDDGEPVLWDMEFDCKDHGVHAYHRTHSEQVAATERIMACVNALAGVPDPEAWVKQRDALYAACKSMASIGGNLPKNVMGGVFFECARDDARAAIAACEEPKP